MKINKNYFEQLMSFGSTCKKLKELNESELNELAIIAKNSSNQILLRCFEDELPSIEKLIEMKVDMEIEKVEDTIQEKSTKENEKLNVIEETNEVIETPQIPTKKSKQ